MLQSICHILLLIQALSQREVSVSERASEKREERPGTEESMHTQCGGGGRLEGTWSSTPASSQTARYCLLPLQASSQQALPPPLPPSRPPSSSSQLSKQLFFFHMLKWATECELQHSSLEDTPVVQRSFYSLLHLSPGCSDIGCIIVDFGAKLQRDGFQRPSLHLPYYTTPRIARVENYLEFDTFNAIVYTYLYIYMKQLILLDSRCIPMHSLSNLFVHAYLESNLLVDPPVRGTHVF